MATAAWKKAMKALIDSVDDPVVYEVRYAGGFVYHEDRACVMASRGATNPFNLRLLPRGLAKWLGLKPCTFCSERSEVA